MKKLQKGFAVFTVSMLMMSMAPINSSVQEDFKKDKQDICYAAAVAYVNGIDGFYDNHPTTQHAIAGAYYDGCMGY